MIAELVNHLWQSTVFAGVVGLLTVVFRRNQARIRYWLWLAASLKFLVPFALLMHLGSQLEWAQTQRSMAVASTVRQFGEPFIEAASAATTSLPATQIRDWLVFALLGGWLCGLVAIAISRVRAWRRIRAAVRSSTPWNAGTAVPGGIQLRATPGLLEPGVVGFWRPMILLPAHIETYLTARQIAAVLAHEICHVQRRDNLTAALHMTVEAVFWFHPLVWWIGARLVNERERACDEQVLREIAEPLAYAQSIVNICKRYVEAPLMSVAGVGGSNINARIEAILSNRVGRKLTLSRRVALATAAVVAVVVPIAVGAISAPDLARPHLTDAAPIFSAATIKPTPPEALGDFQPSIVLFLPGGSFRRTNSTLRTLIRTAYGIHEYEVVGGPSWTDEDRYDIDARSDAPATRNEVLAKLRTLLADRFKLKVQRTWKEDAVYHLVVSSRGSNLQTVPESTPAAVRIDSYAGYRTTAQVADYLGSIVGRPVMDRTGLAGIFDVKLTFSPDPNDPAGVSVFTAVREQLGLQLEPARGPVETIEILDAEKPTEN
jgi:bla regulator protein BlaR1